MARELRTLAELSGEQETKVCGALHASKSNVESIHMLYMKLPAYRTEII